MNAGESRERGDSAPPRTSPIKEGPLLTSSATTAIRLRSPAHFGCVNHRGEKHMARGEGKTAGISVGGIIVVAGILAIIFWSFWIGLVIVLLGLIAFGGFARGKWY